MAITEQMTIDERIEHLLTDRKILLFRYDANLRKEIYKKLTALQKTLINRISAAGVESISKKELDKLLKDIQSIITENYGDVSDYTKGELNELLPLEVAAARTIYNEAVRFDLFNEVPPSRLNAINNAQLIAGSPMEKWWARQGDDLAFKFSGLIRQGMLDGRQTSELITEVKELFGSARRTAETLVRTAVMKVHDKAQETLKNENLDIIKGEQHLSTLDMRTSDVCRVRDGKVWDLEKKPVDHDLPYQRPPLHPNCRSMLKLLTRSWRELGFDIDEIPESTRASMDGQVKESLNYEGWLKGKTQSEQDAVLGKGKAELWRNGVITFRDLLDQSGRPLTLKQLQDSVDMPDVVRGIRRKFWSNEFKAKAENMYYAFEKQGIIISEHGLGRFGERLDKLNMAVDDAVRFIKETDITHIDSRNGRLIRFNAEKKVAVIQSADDDQIITIEKSVLGSKYWKKK